ncbi:covalently-linked cell wall protein [Diplodia corticola]|uniref:Covalently-linked cell wall protein n=1 Tax=Diplodia corticola TaxID=236234 RepID=A0A1J9S404_9PEZI|nr:covalently-linked cell wall protein [Diplodia corticola]OJD34365.1 covalently-linked cell wall protein [Diplodia corticola]
MKFAFALAAVAGTAMALPKAQGVTADLAPTASAPAGCQPTYAGTFQITIVNATTSSSVAKRGLLPRQEESGGPADNALELTLADGKLTDQQGRTGYIASNYQLQFDKPPQAGTIYDDGFSACSNGSLALGGSAIFYGCTSGEGATQFYNFYDRNWGSHCSPIYIEIIKGSSTSAAATQASDGQVAATTAVPVRSDGQPIATSIAASGVPVRSDGQPIATSIAASGVPVRSDGQPIATSIATAESSAAGVPVRSDGQPIASSIASAASSASAVPVRSDGQPIASTIGTPSSAAGTPVPVRSDGQPIATSIGTPVATPVSTPVSTPTAVSIRSDGQPIATGASTPSSAAGTPVSTPTPTPSQYTGDADRFSVRSGFALVGAAAVAVAMF